MLAGCGADGAGGGRRDGPDPAAEAATATPPAPLPPDEQGEYPVGFRTERFVDAARAGRELTTAVWYPAAAGAAGEPASYEIAPEVGYQSRLAVAGAGLAPGRFPLVVLSHGSAGSRVQLASFAEQLASHGYVVAAPDHPGDTLEDFAAGRNADLVELASDRPRDVSAVIDGMLCPDGPFAAAVDPARIGVAGFSFGGFTAVVSSVGVLDAPADPRVRVAVGIAAATEVLPADLVGQVTIPTLLIGGSRDAAAPPDSNVERTFGELTGAPARMAVIVDGAAHNSFTDVCEQALLATDGRVPAGVASRLRLTALLTCLPPHVEPGLAQRAARWYTVAFLQRHLRGDARYDRFLTDGAGPGAGLPVALRARP
ncbi:MAG: dienelactone hydrolase family protein [Frankia sp.]|nr:dienelactone hydrolase family protein [Frankia sp.]